MWQTYTIDGMTFIGCKNVSSFSKHLDKIKETPSFQFCYIYVILYFIQARKRQTEQSMFA